MKTTTQHNAQGNNILNEKFSHVKPVITIFTNFSQSDYAEIFREFACLFYFLQNLHIIT